MAMSIAITMSILSIAIEIDIVIAIDIAINALLRFHTEIHDSPSRPEPLF